MSEFVDSVSGSTDATHSSHSAPNPVVSELISHLRDAAEIEQQFMCMYLYGAFSVKKRYVEGQFENSHNNADVLPPADLPKLEAARRWVSNIYAVARQEMEHLALVNNMLRAVGAAPCFARDNIQDIIAPQSGAADHIWKKYHLSAEGSAVFETDGEFFSSEEFLDKRETKAKTSCSCHEPVKFDFVFTPFTKSAAEAWTCMESPGYKELLKFGPELFANWCFTCKTVEPDSQDVTSDSYAGKINQLYTKIKDLFSQLSPDDYVTSADNQVSIIQQYDIYVFPVTDYASASQAIDLIVKQGEGNDASVDHQSHYRRFFDITQSYPTDSAPLYWNLIENPLESNIHEDYVNTKELFVLSNQAYELLVIILTALYALPQTPSAAPYLAPALKQEAFAPMMTMIIRSLSELLVQLKAGNNDARVASSFEISAEVKQLLLYPYQGMDKSNANHVFSNPKLKDELGNLNHILQRFTRFNDRLQKVELKDSDIANSTLIDWAKERLAYMKENSQRIQVNLSRINQTGIYSLLNSGE